MSPLLEIRNLGVHYVTARGARVNRGGSWYYEAGYVRTTYRATANHIYRRIADLGFRCARSQPPAKP